MGKKQTAGQAPVRVAVKDLPTIRIDELIPYENNAKIHGPEQIEQLRQLVDEENLPVLCFGLRTDFLTHLFPGSRRLFELADSITEIKTICECGSKATVNARIDGEGHVVTEGAQVFLGGNDSYIAMCHACWRRRIARERAERTQKEKQ